MIDDSLSPANRRGEHIIIALPAVTGTQQDCKAYDRYRSGSRQRGG
jgi:hypothetical protein